MNKRQKEVLQSQLDAEMRTLRELKQVYRQALKDCETKIRELSARTDMENLQSIIYQKRYQEALKRQLEGVMTSLQSNSYSTVSDYLARCYQDGYIGAMYDLHGQGIPIIVPIDQKAVTRAIQTDSKISQGLYTRLGEDVKSLKTSIRAELSRGIANGSTWNDVARKIGKAFKNTPFSKAYNNSMRIARTEGHRVQIRSAMDAQQAAKDKGADVVKQWDATLDDRTRETHRILDGQIRELDEPFEVGGMRADAPGMFNNPAEDCNCRCALLQRARWALDEDELKTLKERAKYFGLDKADDFENFKKKYLKAAGFDVDEIKKKISDHTSKINSLVSEYSDKHKQLEKAMLFGGMDVPTMDRLQNEVKALEKSINELKKQIDDLKKLLPEKIHVSKAIVVNGKDLSGGKIDYSTGKFEHDIEAVLNVQGFDGTPTVVEYEEFKDAMQKSNFYAERTYSANTQELLDQYQDELYNGKWYVDCSEGGSQYGQGMYCASCYDITNSKSMGGIGWEMSHYQEIGMSKGNAFSYTESITIQPDAKIFDLPYGADAQEYISDKYVQHCVLKKAADEDYIDAVNEYYATKDELLKIANRYEAKEITYEEYERELEATTSYRQSILEDYPEIKTAQKNAMAQTMYTPPGAKYPKMKDPGTLAAEMGYDAIKADGHGDSGSYTVILNRTKVILCKGGSIYGN